MEGFMMFMQFVVLAILFFMIFFMPFFVIHIDAVIRKKQAAEDEEDVDIDIGIKETWELSSSASKKVAAVFGALMIGLLCWLSLSTPFFYESRVLDREEYVAFEHSELEEYVYQYGDYAYILEKDSRFYDDWYKIQNWNDTERVKVIYVETYNAIGQPLEPYLRLRIYHPIEQHQRDQ